VSSPAFPHRATAVVYGAQSSGREEELMGVRVIVGLEPDADWRDVAQSLRDMGAHQVLPPRAALPDTLVATFEGDAQDAVPKSGGLPGVAYAEPDAERSELSDGDADARANSGGGTGQERRDQD
jgi:hypothetical protein